MTTLKETKKELLNLFYMSVDSDILLWKSTSFTKGTPTEFCSPLYNNKFKFSVDTEHKKIYIYNGRGPEVITNYKYNFKIRSYINKLLKSYLKQKETQQNLEKIRCFQDAIKNLNETFKKEVRKKKLENL